MKTIVFCNARDEENILEWIAHYLNLGFTTVFIFDHKSKIPIQSYIKKPNSDIIIKRIDNDIPMMKTFLMKEAAKYSTYHNYDWMLYIDADEFLFLKNHNSIDTFLNEYKNIGQLCVSTLMFGSNMHTKQPKDGILKSFTRCELIPNECVKTFVIPKYVLTAINPHFYNLSKQLPAIHCELKTLDPETPWWYHSKLTYKDIPAYFAHYKYQAYEEYTKRKVLLPRDDNGKFRDILTEEEIHAIQNDIVNVDLFQKYDFENKIKMEYIKIIN